MAKKKPFPKQPKAGASMETLNTWKKKCEEINKQNALIEKEKTQKKNVREAVKKMKAKAK